jgi:nucleoside-diphosphate-sugar epimerase
MKVNLYGKGFVGSEFVKQFPDTLVNNRGNHLVPQTPKILYTVSTVDNYNIKTDPHLDVDTNLTVLISTLEACLSKYGKNFEFNFVSSWFVYGKTECPAREDVYCNPTGFYGITKRCAEQLLMSYCQTYGIKYRILRLANVLGVEDNKVSLKKNYLQHAIRQLANGETVTLYEGELIRDFIHVSDVARAIALILEKGELNSIYNIGNGVPQSVEWAIFYAHKLLKTGNIVRVPVPEFHKLVQVQDMYLDTDKLDSLGFQPQHAMYPMMDEIARYYAKQ